MAVKTFPTTEHLKEYFSGREKLLGIREVDVKGAEVLPDGWISVPYKDGSWDTRVHRVAVLVFFDAKERGKDYIVLTGSHAYNSKGEADRQEKKWYIPGVPSYISDDSIRKIARLLLFNPAKDGLIVVAEGEIPRNAPADRVKPFDRLVNHLLGGFSPLSKEQRAELIRNLEEGKDIVSCL